MSTELTIYKPQTLEEVKQVANIFVASGLFPNDKNAAQAVVKIIAGQELNLGPFEAISNINFINGVRSFNYPLVAALVQRSGRYRYKVVEEEADHVRIEWFERDDDGKWETIGFSDFSDDDARSANLLTKSNWKMYKKDLLFARALTRGARRYCSSVFGGGGVYTQEELENSTRKDIEVESVSEFDKMPFDMFVTKVQTEISGELTKETIIEFLKLKEFTWSDVKKRTDMYNALVMNFKQIEDVEVEGD